VIRVPLTADVLSANPGRPIVTPDGRRFVFFQQLEQFSAGRDNNIGSDIFRYEVSSEQLLPERPRHTWRKPSSSVSADR